MSSETIEPKNSAPNHAERPSSNLGAELDATKRHKPAPATAQALDETKRQRLLTPQKPSSSPSKLPAPPPLPGARASELLAKKEASPPGVTPPEITSSALPKPSPSDSGSLKPSLSSSGTPKAPPPLPRSSPSTEAKLGSRPSPQDSSALYARSFELAPDVELGDYVLLSPIAQSVMGEVWKARNHKIGKWAAIKVPSHEIAGRKDAAERFLQEARAVNEIRHRNIVDIFDFGSLPDGRPYYVMELLEGRPLSAYLKESGPLTFQEILSIFSPVCQALQAAHDQGIVHRDIKSDNIFLIIDKKSPPFIKVLDFGIAKLHGVLSQDRKDATLPGAVYGTPAYMSPEQCQGASDVDHLADVYSLGVVLYEMITGRLPFLEPSGNTGMLLVKHITARPLPPSKVVKGRSITNELDALLLRALAKDPKARPVSCEVFSEELVKAAKLLRFEEREAIQGAKPVLDAEPRVPGASPTPPPDQESPTETLSVPAEAKPLPLDDSPTETPMLPADIVIDPELTPLAIEATARAAAELAAPALSRSEQGAIPTNVIALRALPPRSKMPLYLAGGVGLLLLGGWVWWPASEPVQTRLVALAPSVEPMVVATAPAKSEPATVAASAPAVADPALVAPPASLAAATISLRFGSSPEGAQVFLDGVLLGVTPLAQEVASSGVEAKLMVVKAGFETVEVTFTPNLPYENQVTLPAKEKVRKVGKTDSKASPKDPKNVVVNPFKKKDAPK